MDTLNTSISASQDRMRRLAATIEVSTDAPRAAEMWMQLEQAQLEHLLTRQTAARRPRIEWSWIAAPIWN